MAEAARASQERNLPACFDKLPRGVVKELGIEIYDALVSLRLLQPNVIRFDGPESCPALRLGERKARYIVERVLEGTRFKSLSMFETDTVKFTGAAAGVLEAVRAGAVDNLLRDLFHTRIRNVVWTLGSANVAPVRPVVMNQRLLGVTRAQARSGMGKPALEKHHRCWLQLSRDAGVVTIGSLRVIDVAYHPPIY